MQGLTDPDAIWSAEQAPGALDSLVFRNEKASKLICKV